MTAVVEVGPTTVTPGYVDGMDQAAYHRHPALSSSQARDLLRTPALYRWHKDHPITVTREMELGTCVHTAVLGVGQMFDMLPGDDLRAKDTREAAAGFARHGLIGLKPAEYALVNGMVDAVEKHPLAGPLLTPLRGTPERALFWRDERTGVDCRALVDFSPHNRASLVDLKTTADASPQALPRHMARYGYPIQAAFYLRGARALGLADEHTEFVWVFVEREPPHGVTVARLAPVDLQWANELCDRALERYRDCTEADRWPGYPDDLITISLPGWARRDYEEDPT